jgi:predicted nucleic acid-binding Zn ribbon protein
MEDTCVCCGEYIPEGRMICYSCEKLPLMIFKKEDKKKMWKKELLKNKLYALLLVIIGTLSIFIEYDATFFIFALMIGLPLFFAKENCIM